MLHQHRKAETDKENFYAKVNFQTTPFSDYNQNNFESQTEMPSCLKDLGEESSPDPFIHRHQKDNLFSSKNESSPLFA